MVLPLKNPYESITFGNSLLLRVDGAIGAMSLSPNGRDAVLAGRRGLFIIDLDEPFTTPRWLHHITSWEVADVQWSPHHFEKPSWCISTSNQKALLWDLARPSDSSILNVLHEHTRAITDINFHPSDPEILATCSIDTFVLSWDMRTPRKAVQKWAEWRAGATQVKWNHDNPYEIASSHDHSFYIWDTRKGALPVLRIEDAHAGKINGIDFSNGLSNIITCSNDQKIKYWDLSTPVAQEFTKKFNYFDVGNPQDELSPSIIVNTDFPVARARNLPFGNERACGVMPLRGGQDAIHILNCDDAIKNYKVTNETQVQDFNPVHSFKGHGGPMKDFLWRKRHETYEHFDTKRNWKEFQLVTWSSLDYDLKLWPIGDDLYKKVNYDPLYQKVLNSLPASGAVDTNKSGSNSPEPSDTSTNDLNLKQEMYTYNTYCIEPPITLNNVLYKNHGDLLSSLTMFQIAKKNKNLSVLPSQLNHLDWISGVRMGRTNDKSDKLNGDDTPRNLGEEVTYVAHTFPKVRFEKISVSTGELILSLRGPLPNLPDSDNLQEPNSPNLKDGDEKKFDLNPDATTVNEASRVESKQSADDKNISDPKSEPQAYEQSAEQQQSTTASTTQTQDTSQQSSQPVTSQDSNEQKLIFIRLTIHFPESYPFLKDIEPTPNMSKKFQKSNFVQFDIEETHELTAPIKEEMLKNLKDISHFFCNKNQRFCLESILRYLMGDKINLDEALIVQTPLEEPTEGELIQEIGNEGWADDLINQQPDEYENMNDSTDEDGSSDDQFSDLMPALNDEEMINSTGSLGRDDMEDTNGIVLQSDLLHEHEEIEKRNKYFDSTPIPKGCGAVWSPNGQLVCFFIPKETEEEENKALQKFSIFKFTDAGFSVGANSHHHNRNEHTRNVDDDEDSNDGDSVNSGSDIEANTNDSSSTSSDSFTNEWDDIEEDNFTSRFRVPGLFKTSVGLGNRYVSTNNRFNNTASNGGTGSNYKSSLPGGADLTDMFSNSKKRKSKGEKKNKNIVGVFDFRHLIPDKQELANEYRVLGDSPENLAKYNSQVAQKYGLREISDAWKLLEMVLIKDIEINDINPVYHSSNVMKASNNNSNPTVARNVEAMNHLIEVSQITKKLFSNNTYRFYWGTHPFGFSWLINEMINYFEKKGNLQMLAMISCILYENTRNVNEDVFNIPIHTPYQIKPQPPSMIQLKRFNESNRGEYERNFSFHESFSTDMSDLKDSNFYNKKHRDSSLLVFKRESLNVLSADAMYARSIVSNFDDELLEKPGNSMFKKSFSLSSPMLENDARFKRQASKSNEFRKPKNISSNNNIHNSAKRPFRNGSSVRPPPTVTVEFENIDTLDLFDDEYTKPLLSNQDENKLKLYREQYANMLYSWGLPANRIKILKFNYPSHSLETHVSKFTEHECRLGFRKSGKLGNGKSSSGHSYPYVSQATSIVTCQNNPWVVNRANDLKYCNLCNLLVCKRLVICTNCEHVLHSHCALEWWSNDEDDECPSGCGCHCLNYRL